MSAARFLEELEIDGVGLCFVSGVAGVKVIAGIIRRRELVFMRRVMDSEVEVQNSIERIRFTNPFIDRNAHLFAFVVRVF